MRKKKIFLFMSTVMDHEDIMLSEISQTKTKLYIMYMWNLKKSKHGKSESTCGYQGLGGWGLVNELRICCLRIKTCDKSSNAQHGIIIK